MKKGDTFQHQFIITGNIYNNFIKSFDDRNPLHTDELFARARGFDSIVMHGNILCGFLSYFVGECLPMKNVMILSQEIMFSKPVYLNDTLAFKADISEVHDSVQVVEFNFQFEKEQNMRVAKGTLKIKLL